MKNTSPHLPVMPEIIPLFLMTNRSGIYLDGTIGYGGHAELIISQLTKNGHLIGIDLDPYALEYTQSRLSKSKVPFSLFKSNYREFHLLLKKMGIGELNGILLDLGISSSQIDSKHRGFSFRYNSKLDMRFDPSSNLTAYKLINEINEKEISQILKEFGDEKYHKRIAQSIYKKCRAGKMETTQDLRFAVENVISGKFLNKSLARVFQAFRIKVNDELSSIKSFLSDSMSFLKKGGRIAIISFHSIEDRIIKQFFKSQSLTCVCAKEIPLCICKASPKLKIITKKVYFPSKSEIIKNPRSRSSKLRVAERI